MGRGPDRGRATLQEADGRSLGRGPHRPVCDAQLDGAGLVPACGDGGPGPNAMRVIIVGCGRVGARTAGELDKLGEHVTVMDVDQRAFQRLPAKFGGVTVRGSGTDEDVLRDAGAEMTDLFMALTDALVTAATKGAEATNGAVLAPTAEPLRGAPVPGTRADEEARAAIAA